MRPPLQITLFGNFRVVDEAGTELLLSNRRGRAVLALLSLTPGEPMDRKKVCDLLWPGRFAAQARASLRQCLHGLMRQLPADAGDVLDVSHTQLAIRPAAISSDLQQIESALAGADADVAIRHLNEMAGLRLLDNMSLDGPFNEWLAAKRLHIEGRLQSATERLADKLSRNGQSEMAAKLLSTWRRSNGKADWRDRVGIAVLPFEQQGQVDEDSLLAEGIVEELCAHLGKVWKLSIIGRVSVNAVMGRGLTLPELATRLNVSHLIDGVVRWTPEGVVVTIQLIDGSTGHELWSGRREGSPETFVSSRQTFSADIVASLCKAMGVENSSAMPRRMTSNREAYALYLQGRSLSQKTMVPGATEKAVELLQKSLELDPDFAEGWTALAEAYVSTIVYAPCLDKVERSAKAAECAQRALELDPEQGYAYAILSIHEWTCFNPSKSLECALQAYRLEPTNADVTMRLGSCLLYLGRTREALPYVEAAIDQDAVNGRNYAMLCTAQLNLGNLEAALAAGQSMVDMGLPGFHLALAQTAMGDHEAAIETYYDIRRFVGTMIMSPPGSAEISDEARDYYLLTAAKGVCSGDAGARQAYCNLVEMLHQTLPEPYDHSVAWPAIWMGHTELVMKIYRECIHPANMPGLMHLWADIAPMNRTIKHAGFITFAEDIGMVEAWEKYG